MATPSLKGTRKTYSFEEREILITLINKYEDIEDRKSDPISMCKRKSAWSQLANEYNSMVGPQGSRSAVQLRRCWENMKACKKNREERKFRSVSDGFCYLSKEHMQLRNWESRNCSQTVPETPVSSGLPPNVVFEPKDSEPFTLQSVFPLKPLKLTLKKEDIYKDSDFSGVKMNCSSPSQRSYALSQNEKSGQDTDSPTIEVSDDENMSERNLTDNHLTLRTHGTQTIFSPSIAHSRRTKKFADREEELQMLAISEAQMKVDIAAMLKEEARIKLEEAHYRKEEARLRMLLFTYKLDRIKED